jgi:hypothetical protein
MSDPELNCEVTIRVPVSITLKMPRDFAEWTDKEELCRYVDAILKHASVSGVPFGDMVPMAPSVEQGFECEYSIQPHWDYLPLDECEITSTDDERLFPDPNTKEPNQ